MPGGSVPVGGGGSVVDGGGGAGSVVEGGGGSVVDGGGGAGSGRGFAGTVNVRGPPPWVAPPPPLRGTPLLPGSGRVCRVVRVVAVAVDAEVDVDVDSDEDEEVEKAPRGMTLFSSRFG